MTGQDFLFEIGCEELPPSTLNKLSQSLSHHIKTELEKAGLSFDKNIQSFATPRRLAILIGQLATEQPPRIIERQGPHVKTAFGKDNTPTLACLGFARSCGVLTDQLQIKKTRRGDFVYCQIEEPGKPTEELLPQIIQTAIKQLSISKAMRWGSHDEVFIRPIHWVLMLFGKEVVRTTLLGKTTSAETRGHRFHHPKPITINYPSDYQQLLLTHGMVIAHFEKRREKIKNLIKQTAADKGEVIIDNDLLDEVTGMVEWPVALLGSFKPEFLKLPPEVLITSMKVHQRYFPIKDSKGNLLPYFVLISNIQSKDPNQIIKGNERVINARLTDASFFYKNDLQKKLENQKSKLSTVVFQRQLGTLADKTKRICKLATLIAKKINVDESHARRAATLAKCDLISEMVYEFPNLQGIMGCYYALNDKENKTIAEAIKEHYQPRFSGDTLPKTLLGACLALSDRLDTIVGIIGINKLPTGDKDPFGLRRAAVGILRILIEKKLNLDLLELLNKTKESFNIKLPNKNVIGQSFDFIMERLRTWYVEKSVSPSIFLSVLSSHPTIPLDFDRRIKAVQHFQTLPEAKALAAANKRVSNILKNKLTKEKIKSIDYALFESDAEYILADKLKTHIESVNNLYEKSDYTTALSELASLKEPVDKFFDEVMVMTEDKKKRDNRLALLSSLQELFTKIADISVLS